MQTAFAPNIIPTKRAEPGKINEKWLWKKLSLYEDFCIAKALNFSTKIWVHLVIKL